MGSPWHCAQQSAAEVALVEVMILPVMYPLKALHVPATASCSVSYCTPADVQWPRMLQPGKTVQTSVHALVPAAVASLHKVTMHCSLELHQGQSARDPAAAQTSQ